MSTCAICVEDTDSPVCCVPCGHVYCRECIDNWQKSKKSVPNCPECREEIQNVIGIYIKRDELKDKEKAHADQVEDLQTALAECKLEQARLETELLNHKEEFQHMNVELEVQKEKTIMYAGQFRSCLTEKRKLEKMVENMKKREENIKNDNEQSIKKYKVLKEKKKHLEESQKMYEDINKELNEDIRMLENRWLVKLVKKFDKITSTVLMLFVKVTAILTNAVTKPVNVTKITVGKGVEMITLYFMMLKDERNMYNVTLCLENMLGYLYFTIASVVLSLFAVIAMPLAIILSLGVDPGFSTKRGEQVVKHKKQKKRRH